MSNGVLVSYVVEYKCFIWEKISYVVTFTCSPRTKLQALKKLNDTKPTQISCN
jgi:hypothetical protein